MKANFNVEIHIYKNLRKIKCLSIPKYFKVEFGYKIIKD